MSFYRHHLFFCSNQRVEGEACCGNHDANAMRDYAKQKGKALGLSDIRVNKAGCLGRCELGPVLVVYPEAVWYTYVDQEDIDEIMDSHVVAGKIVERLKG